MFTKHEIIDRILALRAEGQKVWAGYNLACLIADSALFDHTDKAGNDYAHHTSVVSRMNTMSETKMIIGKLHDVVEDSDWTLDDLRTVGFSEEVINGVDAMTKRDDELYFDFIVRCGRDPFAIDVKINDLNHNMTLSRNNTLPTARDMKRWSRYTLSYNYLVDIKRQNITPGTPMADWMVQQDEKLQDWELLAEYSSQWRPKNPPAPNGPAI